MLSSWKRQCLILFAGCTTLVIVADAEAQIFRRRRAMNRSYYGGSYNQGGYRAGYGQSYGTYGGAAVTAPGVGVDAGPGGAAISAPGVGVQAGAGGARVDAPGVSIGGAVAPAGANVDIGAGARANFDGPGARAGVGGRADLQDRRPGSREGRPANDNDLDRDPGGDRARGPASDIPGEPPLAPRQDRGRDRDNGPQPPAP